MNDWDFKKFFIILISIQISVFGLIKLDHIGINLPIIRQIICFVYLTFIPGFLLLRIFRIHKIDNIKAILYSIGLSLSVIIFTGFLINMFYPLFGITKPLSINNLLITFFILISLLSIICYYRNDKLIYYENLKIKEIFKPITLILFCLIILSIFSTYILNLNGNNFLQMILILILSIIPILLILFNVKEKYFPYIIFFISISLLYHTTLISNYVWGSDINHELYFSKMVIDNYKWDSSYRDNVNAMLSIVILAPIYSIFLNIDLSWIFKLIYPTLFSLIPVGLYYIYKNQMNYKISFLASFFFMSIFTYYNVMPALARQQIAEIFFVLIILLIIDYNLNKYITDILFILFGSLIIVSHYGLSYLFLFSLIISCIFINLFNIIKHNNYKKYNILKNTYIIYLIVISISWFLYISNSSIFFTGVSIGDAIISSITEILKPSTSQALNIATSNLSIFLSIERYLHIICQIFICLGIITALLSNKLKFNKEYLLFSISFFLIDIFGIILPYFASTMNSDRLYHISLFFLSPFCIIGAISLFKFLIYSFKINYLIYKKLSLFLISLFICIFLLFNSAFMYQIFDEPKIGRFALDINVDFPRFNEKELSAAFWLKSHKVQTKEIYSDVNKAIILHGIIGDSNELETYEIEKGLIYDDYIFLGTYNIKYQKILVRSSWNTILYIKNPFNFNESKIYNNNGNWILISR
jgi:uncharacterized membrane protein